MAEPNIPGGGFTEEMKVKISADITEMQKSLQMISKQFGDTGQKSQSAFDKLIQQTEKAGQKMKSIGTTMTMGITAPLAGVATASLTAFANFDQGLANIKSVSGATAQEMSQLEKLALDLGKSTKFSATEAAAGIEELIKAGLTVGQVANGGLEGALTLAAAGDLELAEAAEIASTALNAFKSDNLSVANAADILAGAANASATSVQELKFGLSMVSAVASGAGLSFKDTNTALALFANNGLKGSDAGTSLKTMLMNLSPSTKEATETMKELGIITEDGTNQFYDAEGKLKSFADVTGVLRKAMEHLNPKERGDALKTMFGSDAIRAGNIMFKEGAQGVRDMADAMSKITAAETAKTKMDSLKGSIEELKGTIETLGIEMGKTIGPSVRKLVDNAKGLVEKFGELDEATKLNIIKMAGFAAAMGPVIFITGQLITSMSAIAGVGKLIFTAKMIANVKKFATAIRLLPLLLNPVGGAIALIVGALAVWLGKDLLKDGKFGKSLDKAPKKVETAREKIEKELKKLEKEMNDLNLDVDEELFEYEAKVRIGAEVNENEIVSALDKLKSKTVSEIQKLQTEDVNVLQGFFDKVGENNKIFDDEAQTKMLESLNKNTEDKLEKVEVLTTRYNEIVQTAMGENRKLKATELAELKKINDEIASLGLEGVQRLNDQSTILNERIAQTVDPKQKEKLLDQLVNTAKKKKDEEVKAAETAYEKELLLAAQFKNSKVKADRELGKQMAAEALAQKEQAIVVANETYMGVLTEVDKMAIGTKGKVDFMRQEFITNLEAMEEAANNLNLDGVWNKANKATAKGTDLIGAWAEKFGNAILPGKPFDDSGIETSEERWNRQQKEKQQKEADRILKEAGKTKPSDALKNIFKNTTEKLMQGLTNSKQNAPKLDTKATKQTNSTAKTKTSDNSQKIVVESVVRLDDNRLMDIVNTKMYNQAYRNGLR